MSRRLEIIQNQETNSEYPNIRFEPGLHGSLADSEEANFELWNSEVATRLEKYKPEVIAIDGVMASPDRSFRPDLELKRLPCLPGEINPENPEFFFIRGDPGSFPVLAILASSQNSAETYEILCRLREKLSFDYKKWFMIESLGPPSAGGFLLSNAMMKKEWLSRRKFLKSVIGMGCWFTVSISLFGSRLAIVIGAAGSETEQSRENFQKLATILRPRLKEHSWWVDGRTALLAAKTEEAIDILGKPKGTNAAIVMGPGHTFEGQRLLENKEARKEVIRRFAEKTILICDDVLSEYGFGGDRPAAHQAMLKEISLTDILWVGDVRKGMSKPALEKRVRLIESFMSPQVEEAIKGLG